MSQTRSYIDRLRDECVFGPAERSRLRTLAGGDLDESVAAFDLFSGLWWPLRRTNQRAPRREVAWLVAKLYGVFPLAPVDGASVPAILGCGAPREPHELARHRRRFDGLLCAPLVSIEPHLRWALSLVRREVVAGRAAGLDWVQLTDQLSAWDRGEQHRLRRDVRDLWAEQFLENLPSLPSGARYAD